MEIISFLYFWLTLKGICSPNNNPLLLLLTVRLKLGGFSGTVGGGFEDEDGIIPPPFMVPFIVVGFALFGNCRRNGGGTVGE